METVIAMALGFVALCTATSAFLLGIRLMHHFYRLDRAIERLHNIERERARKEYDRAVFDPWEYHQNQGTLPWQATVPDDVQGYHVYDGHDHYMLMRGSDGQFHRVNEEEEDTVEEDRNG